MIVILTPIVCEDSRSFYYVKVMEDYNSLTNEELKEMYDDMVADYWVDYYKSNPEEVG